MFRKIKEFWKEYNEPIKEGLISGISMSAGVYGTLTVFLLIWKKLGFTNK